MGRQIRWFTRGWANHAFVVVGVEADGTPVVSQETPRRGDIASRITALNATRIAVVQFDDASPEQLAAVVEFGQWAQGRRYGFAACLGDALGQLLHVELGLGIADHMNCSEASTRAAERAGYIPSRSPESMRPIDLARDLGLPSWPGVGSWQ